VTREARQGPAFAADRPAGASANHTVLEAVIDRLIVRRNLT